MSYPAPWSSPPFEGWAVCNSAPCKLYHKHHVYSHKLTTKHIFEQECFSCKNVANRYTIFAALQHHPVLVRTVEREGLIALIGPVLKFLAYLRRIFSAREVNDLRLLGCWAFFEIVLPITFGASDDRNKSPGWGSFGVRPLSSTFACPGTNMIMLRGTPGVVNVSWITPNESASCLYPVRHHWMQNKSALCIGSVC